MLIFKSNFDVEYIQHMGSDEIISRAARVSSGADESKPYELLLRSLMVNRHGSPFECGGLTMKVTIPIFLWREWHRHRVGFSYNEESGRYKQLEPVFYVPDEARLKTCIKPSSYKPMQPGFRQFSELKIPEPYLDDLKATYRAAYECYESNLDEGMDNGLARTCLPVAIYSSCYVTCNPRSLMNFLELRTDEESATRRSHPQYEMHQVAKQVEELFAKYWPVTHKFWNEFGRRSP